MSLLLLALAVIVVSGCAALLAGGKPKLGSCIGAGEPYWDARWASSLLLQFCCRAQPGLCAAAWSMPCGSFFIELDALSAFFLIPVFVLSALAAVYGGGYLMKYKKTKRLGFAWFCYALLVASMAMVCLARNAVLFLLAWEIMALASFFLVAFEHEKPEVRRASWIYLVATHLGTACLLVMFLLLGAAAGSLDFDRFAGSLPRAGERDLFYPRPYRFRHQGRHYSVACMAPRGASRGPKPCFGPDVGHHD